MPIKQTEEEYINKLINLGDKFTLIGNYYNSTTPTLHECNKCHYQWSVRPGQLIRPNAGCPKCTSWKNNVEKVDQLLNKYNFTRESEYLGALKPIILTHTVCGHTWTTKYSYIQQGSGCPKCNIGFGYLGNKTVESAYFYLLEILMFGGVHFLKVGVTTRPIERRIAEILRDLGKDVLLIKKILVVKDFGSSVLKKEQIILSSSIEKFALPVGYRMDGATELYPYKELDNIFKLING